MEAHNDTQITTKPTKRVIKDPVAYRQQHREYGKKAWDGLNPKHEAWRHIRLPKAVFDALRSMRDQSGAPTWAVFFAKTFGIHGIEDNRCPPKNKAKDVR